MYECTYLKGYAGRVGWDHHEHYIIYIHIITHPILGRITGTQDCVEKRRENEEVFKFR